MNVLIFLFGVWFNPWSISHLQATGVECRITMNSDRRFNTKFTCEKTARMINEAAR